MSQRCTPRDRCYRAIPPSVGPIDAGKQTQDPLLVTVNDDSGAPNSASTNRWETNEHSGWCIRRRALRTRERTCIMSRITAWLWAACLSAHLTAAALALDTPPPRETPIR